MFSIFQYLNPKLFNTASLIKLTASAFKKNAVKDFFSTAF